MPNVLVSPEVMAAEIVSFIDDYLNAQCTKCGYMPYKLCNCDGKEDTVNRAEYYAELQAMNAKAPGKKLPKQKFERGTRVKVDKKLRKSMSHFESGFEAIVEFTHGQQFGGSDADSYSLIVLNDAGEPINSIAWYYEKQLTLVSDDIDKGLKILEIWGEYEKTIKPW